MQEYGCRVLHTFQKRPGSSVGQTASLSRQRSGVRVPFGSPLNKFCGAKIVQETTFHRKSCFGFILLDEEQKRVRINFQREVNSQEGPQKKGRQMPLQLSWQSRGLKIPVSLVRFRPEAPLICGFSSFGRASPCQGEGGGFEPRNPLQNKNSTQQGAIFILARPTVVRARTSEAS